MRLKSFLALGFLSVVAILSGCATTSSTEKRPALSDSAREQAWQKNRAIAEKLVDWHVYGRAGVVTPKQSGSVTINWDRNPSTYSISMSDPLGRTLARLEGQDDGRVLLNVSGQQPVYSNRAEDLLYRQTGWLLPFGSLDYWMRGLPAPGRDYVRLLNNQGYLAELQQNGWTVVYGSYKDINGVHLPAKIRAEKNGVKVIFSIRKWTLVLPQKMHNTSLKQG